MTQVMRLPMGVTLITNIVTALKLSDKCNSLMGKYFDQKCYLYINHTVLNWNDAMDYCKTAVTGYNGHLAHILSSKTLNILKDLTRPFPTGSQGDWTESAFIGARVDGSNHIASLDHINARFATEKAKLVDDVSVADTFLGTVNNIIDSYRNNGGWAVTVWTGSGSDPYNWERGEIYETKTRYFFCQINEQYSSMVNTKISRVLKVPLLNGYTVANELDCLVECSMRKLCRGFNYNENDGSCELTSWDPVDLKPNDIEQNSSWRFYVVK